MDGKQMKLENPARLGELKPHETLIRIGLKDGDVLCDIGAGSGIFTLPAAAITTKTVYALEISSGMLAVISEKAKIAQLDNVVTVKAENGRFAVGDGAADIALMVTVLHEIPNKPAFLGEVKRMLKTGGKAAVIEFHKGETAMGPPAALRISEEETDLLFSGADFMKDGGFDLGSNYYCRMYKKA